MTEKLHSTRNLAKQMPNKVKNQLCGGARLYRKIRMMCYETLANRNERNSAEPWNSHQKSSQLNGVLVIIVSLVDVVKHRYTNKLRTYLQYQRNMDSKEANLVLSKCARPQLKFYKHD